MPELYILLGLVLMAHIPIQSTAALSIVGVRGPTTTTDMDAVTQAPETDVNEDTSQTGVPITDMAPDHRDDDADESPEPKSPGWRKC